MNSTEREIMNEDDKLVMDWTAAKDALAQWKAHETALRTKVFEKFFKPQTKGTQTISLGNDYKLKATRPQKYKVDADHVDGVLSQLEDHVSAAIVKRKFELSVSAYKNLSETDKNLMDSVLTMTWGTPSMELVKPKEVPTV